MDAILARRDSSPESVDNGRPRTYHLGMPTETSIPANVQTPTGMVHAGRIANVHGREALIPACIAVNGYTGLRAAWETDAAVTCRKCLPSTRVSKAESKEDRKARLAAERKASALHLAEQRVAGGERLLESLLEMTPRPDAAADYAATILERVADLEARRAELAALTA